MSVTVVICPTSCGLFGYSSVQLFGLFRPSNLGFSRQDKYIRQFKKSKNYGENLIKEVILLLTSYAVK